MTRKLLFLDFDGVLHPNFTERSGCFSRAAFLESALDAPPAGFGIVISSSWRFHFPMQEIHDALPARLSELVVGATPEVEPGRHQRYREIAAYLSSAGGRTDWRALDDELTAFPTSCTQLIACDGKVGMGDYQAGLIRNWLDASA